MHFKESEVTQECIKLWISQEKKIWSWLSSVLWYFKNRWTINSSGNKFLKISSQGLVFVNGDRKFGSLNIKNKIYHMSQQTFFFLFTGFFFICGHFWSHGLTEMPLKYHLITTIIIHISNSLVYIICLLTMPNSIFRHILSFFPPEPPWTNPISTICFVVAITF